MPPVGGVEPIGGRPGRTGARWSPAANEPQRPYPSVATPTLGCLVPADPSGQGRHFLWARPEPNAPPPLSVLGGDLGALAEPQHFAQHLGLPRPRQAMQVGHALVVTVLTDGAEGGQLGADGAPVPRAAPRSVQDPPLPIGVDATARGALPPNSAERSSQPTSPPRNSCQSLKRASARVATPSTDSLPRSNTSTGIAQIRPRKTNSSRASRSLLCGRPTRRTTSASPAITPRSPRILSPSPGRHLKPYRRRATQRRPSSERSWPSSELTTNCAVILRA